MGEPHRKWPLGRLKRWEDSIKMDIKKTGCEDEFDWIGLPCLMLWCYQC
jgi:hypothetical protein